MTNQFHKLLLSELRMVVCQPGTLSELNDRLLCEAVTLNENLQSLGFVLKPDDLIRLAVSPSLRTFFEDVKALVPEVKAQPMYPGFPQQVMEMSEAELRMHQMMHYFSTYGLERIFGVKISRGWLPEYRHPARTREDTALLEARVLDLITEEEAPARTLSILMARRERLTNPELDLVVEAASLCTAEQMQELTVRFKENLDLLFPKLLEDADRETALRTLRILCSHAGDVLRCTAAYLSRRRYHLRTSEKKLLVKLLESYSVWNFRQNLMQSNSLRERNLMILKHLDYNLYSRSPAHKEAVRALRNSELLSWHGIGEELLKNHSPKALSHLAQRPGYMLRILNRLLSLDYSAEDILDTLRPRSGAISAHLLLQAIRSLANKRENLEANRKQELRDWERRYTQAHWQYDEQNVENRCRDGKQNCINRYIAAFSYLLPENSLPREQDNCSYQAQVLRTYAQRETDGHRAKAQREAEKQMRSRKAAIQENAAALRHLQDTSVFRSRPYLRAVAEYNMKQAGDSRPVSEAVLTEYLPPRFREAQKHLMLEIQQLHAQLAEDQAQADAWLAAELEKIRNKTALEYEEKIRQIDGQEQAELAALAEKYRKCPDPYAAEREALTKRHGEELEQLELSHRQIRADARLQRNTLIPQMEKEQAAIEEKYRAMARTLCFNDAAVRILKELLRAHFRQVATQLQGKKVFCDLKQFDLKHSSLETGNRSMDGGYIRSGISWKIPDNAKYVRFFVYWNDRKRVDIDLHVGATTVNGEHLHVGWNADFRSSGVVHSGDITHSNAAEYIDIDLTAPIREISANVHLYYGKCSFPEVETCYVGMMAVDQIGQEVKHYSPKNCFFTHELTQNVCSLFYGFVDVQNRCVRFVGQPNECDWDSLPRTEEKFSLQDYLDCVLEAQKVQIVHCPEDAEVILSMGKSLSKKGISLVDSNFFLEC